ncbi:DUF1367 family protein [Noviherbaspirillum malthae]|uniref:DUF1367 family protein n=1 Tax=Noviherbaspirillum malthae TaxID=1260987 RepID=UPI001E5E8945|nr:DUF1367 family protein [Noviherbaspirillum malthae]
MLAKMSDAELTQEQRQLMRAVLFEMVDGISEADKKTWRRFWNWIMKSGSGEIFSIETWTPRNGRFHRLHMKIETSVFASQERIQNFEQFRTWLKIGAGFVDWMAGPKGGVVPVPRSISYKKCDEDTMRRFHADAIAFLRSGYAQKYLWPHLAAVKAQEMIEGILVRFEE